MRRSHVRCLLVPLIAAVAAGCGLVVAKVPAPRSVATDPPVELSRVVGALALVDSGGDPQQNDDPKAAQLLSWAWKLLAQSAALRLSVQHVTKLDVEMTLTDLGCPGPEIDCDVVPLSDGVFLILSYLRDSEVSSFFILDCRDRSRPPVAWNLEEFAESHRHENRHLQDWTAQRWYGDWSGYHVTRASQLPDDQDGRRRFYIMAMHAGQGMTVAAQLSVWAWDGREAALLVAGEYALMLDSDADIALDEGILKVPTKEDFRTFSTNRASEEPRGVWPIRISPNGVEDLGPRHLVRELRLIDDLFYRVQRRQPATDIAAPSVISYLRRVIPDAGPNLKPEDDYEPLGEMWGWRRVPTQRGFRVCLDVDVTGPLEYTIDYVKG
jgi:hypothetical protein